MKLDAFYATVPVPEPHNFIIFRPAVISRQSGAMSAPQPVNDNALPQNYPAILQTGFYGHGLCGMFCHA